MIGNYSGHVANPNSQQQNNRSNNLQSSVTGRNAFGHQASHGNANNNTNLAAILPLLLQLIIALVQQLIGNKGNDDTGSDQHKPESGVIGEDGDREGVPLGEIIRQNTGGQSDQGTQTQPAFTIDLNKDGVTNAGDLIVDPTNRMAQKIGSISPVVGGLQDLESKINQQQNIEANLSDNERKNLEEKSKASQFDVISLVPKNSVDTTIPSQDADRHFAIDMNRDGTFSSGDLLVDLDRGDARRVNVDSNPVIVNDLSGLQAQMEKQRDLVNNLSEAEQTSIEEKAEANRFDLLGPESFSTS